MLTGLNIDEYFTRTDTSGTATFLSDALGSTIGLTNSSGAIATNYTYAPFGNVTASGSANANTYQFTGRENDGNGLYYYRARYYSPGFQRFIGQDPIGFTSRDPDLYGYVLNSPATFIDPLGLAAGEIGVSIGGSIGILNVSGYVFFGIAVDGNGNVGFIGSVAGGLGSSPTLDLAGGFSFGGSLNAKTICDLEGPFVSVNASGGDGFGAGVEGYSGSSPDGVVTGMNVTIGPTIGLAGWAGLSETQVIPILHLPHW